MVFANYSENRNKTKSIIFLIMLPFLTFSQNIDELFGNSGEIYFSFSFKNINELNELSKIISIDHKTDYEKAYAYANRSEFSKFLNFGISYDIIDEKVDKSFFNNSNRSNWDYYPSYSEYSNMMQAFEDSFPSICKLHNIGTLSSGHEILILQISDNIGTIENEPSFLYTSTMHGNELTGYVLMLRLADEILNGYGVNPRYTNIINEVDIWINPLANPDGTYNNGNTIQMPSRYNFNNVDLNRNFTGPIQGDHPDGNEWQDETIFFMNLADSVSFDIGCNIHSGAEVFNYPWDMWSNLTADDEWWQYVGRSFADTIHANSFNYFNSFDNGITNGAQWYEIHGGRQDFMNYFKFCREFTLEMSNEKIPNPDDLPLLWNYNKNSLINFIEQSLFGLRGIVTDSISGQPISAKVEIISHDIDSSHVYSKLPVGNYHRFLFEGNYDVTFSKSGYYSKTVNKDIYANFATNLDVKLVPLTVDNSMEVKIPRTVVNSYDVLGRPSKNKNSLLIEVYNDGTVKKTINNE